MLGGYQILDLRNIGLTLGNSQVSITDAEILNQLRNLRNYIEKGHDYKKALDNSPKPILIRYRDAKNNEKLEVSAFASVTSSNNSLTYDIRAKGLDIEVVFEEKTDDDGNKYYDIKTAKYLYSENESVEGDMSIGGDLEVEGDAKLFENIVDKDGHKRFIEGDITIIDTEGLTQKYGKWSLCGSHLLIVLACEIANGTTISGKRCVIDVPNWVKDKIVPLFASLVIYKQEVAFANDSSSQNMTFYLQKSSVDGEISIHNASITASAIRNFRIAFDLLIDNE